MRSILLLLIGLAASLSTFRSLSIRIRSCSSRLSAHATELEQAIEEIDRKVDSQTFGDFAFRNWKAFYDDVQWKNSPFAIVAETVSDFRRQFFYLQRRVNALVGLLNTHLGDIVITNPTGHLLSEFTTIMAGFEQELSYFQMVQNSVLATATENQMPYINRPEPTVYSQKWFLAIIRQTHVYRNRVYIDLFVMRSKTNSGSWTVCYLITFRYI